MSKISNNNTFCWSKGHSSLKINPQMNVNTKHVSNYNKFELALTSCQKRILKSNNLNLLQSDIDISLDPWIIPPLEFYADIQDVCKMFCNFKSQMCWNRTHSRITCNKTLCKKCTKIENKHKRNYEMQDMFKIM